MRPRPHLGSSLHKRVSVYVHCRGRTDMTTHPTVKESAKRFASVIQALQAYEVVCTYCATESDRNGYAEAMIRYVGVRTDYAGYRALTRKLLEHDSEFVGLFLEDCVEICSQCVEECDHHG